MSLRSMIAFVAVLFIIYASVAFALETGEPAPKFELKDQFAKLWKLSNLKDDVVVVVAATRESGRAMGPWVDKLKAKYNKKIHLLGLLDLHKVPGIGRGIAKSRIRSETKDPLMLDWDGKTGKAYHVSDKYPVVVVIDKNGVAQAVQATNFTTQAYDTIVASIDKNLNNKSDK